MVNQFGIDGDKAMNLIAAGAQNGLDYSGELLDSISEYSVQFEMCIRDRVSCWQLTAL